jgi:hypothetical protein
MNSLNTIIANAMEKSKLGEASFYEDDLFSPPSMEEKFYFDDTIPPIYDDYNDEYDIFSPPTIEEKISYDYNMPPIFDDYGDENNNDSYFVEFAPTTINKNDYVYVESINSFKHVVHDKNVLGDIYIVNFIHDATESYYERGKHGFMHLNNIKFPLFMLKILKLHLFCFPMLVALCFMTCFFTRLFFIGSGSYLNVFRIYFLMLSFASSSFLALTQASFKITMSNLMAIKKELLGDNPLYFCF